MTFLVSAHLMALDYQQRWSNWYANQVSQRDSVISGRVKYEFPDGSFSFASVTGSRSPIHPPQPLSALVKGVDGEINRTVSISERIFFGARQDEPAIGTASNLPDTSFVIKLLVSLFALFFSVDAVTFEKETGTLRAVLALPIRRYQVFLAKLVAAYFSLLVSFAIAYSIVVAFLYFAHGLITSREDLLRILFIFCTASVYGLIFVFIGLFISAIAARTKIAVTRALLVWVSIVLVLPNTSVLLAKLLFPTPSLNQFNARLHEARQRIRQTALQVTPTDQQAESRISQQTMLRIFEVERRMTDEYLVSKKRQTHQARLYAVFSPAGALSFGLSDLAGTGISAYDSYLDILRSGQDKMIDSFIRRFDLPPQAGINLVQEAKSEAGRQRHQESLGASLRSATVSILSLLVFAVLCGWAAYRQFEHCNVK